MKNKTKIITVGLYLALVFSPMAVFGQSTSDIQSQINTLMQRVRDLQAQLAQYQSSIGVNTDVSTTAPRISYITPTSGRRGIYITIYGSGFTASDSIQFSDLGTYMAHNYVNSGTLTFTPPSSLSNCSISGTSCTGGMTLVKNGPYNIRVINGKGTSNVVPFTVTGVSNY